MSELIIHVGSRKTGSSSIQQSLCGLENEQAVYGNIRGYTNHGAALCSLAVDNPSVIAHHRNRRRSGQELIKYVDSVKEDIEKVVRRARERKVIFSGETISHLLKIDDLQRLREFFLQYFRQIRIIAYVRTPRAYIESNFQQRLKVRARKIDLKRDLLNYKDTFEKFDRVFDRSNCSLIKFDPRSFPKACVVRDFCSRLGVALPEDRVVRVNESLSREAMGLLFCYRKYGGRLGSLSMTPSQNKRLVQRLKSIGKHKFHFAPGFVDPVLEKNTADIDWMEKRLGDSLDESEFDAISDSVSSEEDLIRVSPETLEELCELLRSRPRRTVVSERPEDIADKVHELWSADVSVTDAIVNSHARPRIRSMQRPVDRHIQISASALATRLIATGRWSSMASKRAHILALIRATYRCISISLDDAPQEKIFYEDLGEFEIRQEAEKSKRSGNRQIVFHPASNRSIDSSSVENE